MNEQLAYNNASEFKKSPAKESVASKAFNLEYLPRALPRGLIRDDIISYLGEYRLQVPKFHYEYMFSRGESGKFELRDSHQGEAMTEKANRAIWERQSRGERITREKAELDGLRRLEDQLRFAKNGDSVLWASPPGPKEEGYGDYGFIYKGELKEVDGVRKLSMTAIRVESPTVEKFNNALIGLTGDKHTKTFAEEFLEDPRVVRQEVSDKVLDAVLKKEFSFLAEGDVRQQEFDRIIRRLSPIIEDVVDVMQNGTKVDRLAALRSLENYTLRLKEGDDFVQQEGRVYPLRRRLNDILPEYNFVPPVVAGSCGSTGEEQSNNILSIGSSLSSVRLGGDMSKDIYGDRKFKCPSCSQSNIRPINELIAACQHCGSTEVAC